MIYPFEGCELSEIMLKKGERVGLGGKIFKMSVKAEHCAGSLCRKQC